MISVKGERMRVGASGLNCYSFAAMNDRNLIIFFPKMDV